MDNHNTTKRSSAGGGKQDKAGEEIKNPPVLIRPFPLPGSFLEKAKHKIIHLMKLPKKLSLFVLSSSLLFTGCIGDDLSGCPPDSNVTLAFSYPNFPDRISRVTVSIYDSNTCCLISENRQVDKSELDLFQGIGLTLPAGSYTAVCWGNAFDNTRINGCSIGEDLTCHEVGNPCCFTLEADTITTNDALYYGIRDFTVHPNTRTTQTVAFTPAHIWLIVQVQGLPSTAAEQPACDYPYIKVNNLPPTYDYQMITHGNPTTYYPAVTVTCEDLLAEARLDVLRFEKDTPVTIDVVENKTTNEILHTLDLRSFIEANNIDMTAGREVVIPVLITFGGDQSVITVGIIENWSDLPVNPVPQQ